MAALIAEAGLEIGEEVLPSVVGSISNFTASVGVGIGSVAAGVGVGIEKVSEVVEHVVKTYDEITDQPKRIEENVTYGSDIMAEKSAKDGQYNSFQNPVTIQRPNIQMVPPAVDPAANITSPIY